MRYLHTMVRVSSLDDSLAFFFEAQNDLLVSHCLAREGSFRQALKALPSFTVAGAATKVAVGGALLTWMDAM